MQENNLSSPKNDADIIEGETSEANKVSGIKNLKKKKNFPPWIYFGITYGSIILF
ncbi:MAG: hypothetical protein GF308_09365 [Candidatus Heimdallarchaeota archaeon]|nr:hypothetical protein [Candidatus Heimdallarchaeota archaeon]